MENKYSLWSLGLWLGLFLSYFLLVLWIRSTSGGLALDIVSNAWGVTLFLIPFVALGLGIIGWMKGENKVFAGIMVFISAILVLILIVGYFMVRRLYAYW